MVDDDRGRHLARGRDRVVGEGPGEEGAARVVAKLFEEGRPDPLRERPPDLPVHHRGVEADPRVVPRHVAVDPDLGGRRVHLDPATVEHEGVGARRVDAVLGVGGSERGRRPHLRHPEPRLHALREGRGRPVEDPGEAGERDGVVGVVGRMDTSGREDEVAGAGVQLPRGHLREPVADPERGAVGSPGDRPREPARIVARRDRPALRLGVVLEVDDDLLRGEPEDRGHHLGEDGAVALALGRRGGGHRHRAARVEAHRRGRHRAVLGAGPGPRLGREQGGDVAHVGDARLHDRGVPDAVETPLAPRRTPAGEEFVEPALGDRPIDEGREVARVVPGAGRRPVGNGGGRNEVPADDVEGIEAEPLGDPPHERLEGEEHLRPAEPPIEAGRGLVGERDPVADREVLDVVRAGHEAVHPVEGGGLGGPEVGAAVLDLVVAQRPHPPVVLDRRLETHHAVGGRGGGGEVLHPVLRPAHRPAGRARREGKRHDVDEGGLLEPEASARVPRGAQAQARPRHPERPRHHRMQGVRPLEVRMDLVHAFAREPGRGDHDALDRGADVAGIPDLDLDPVRRGAERGLGVGVAEAPLVDEVRAERFVKHRRGLAEGLLGVDDRGPRRVLDLDPLRRVLREVPVARHHHRDGLPRVAHAAGREAAVLDRRAHHDEERVGPGGRGRPGEDRVHAVHRERLARVDRDDVGVRPGRAHEAGVARVGGEGHVVRELRFAGDEGRVLEPRDGPPDHLFALRRFVPGGILFTARAGRARRSGRCADRGRGPGRPASSRAEPGTVTRSRFAGSGRTGGAAGSRTRAPRTRRRSSSSPPSSPGG